MAAFGDIIVETLSAIQAAKQNARQAEAEAELIEQEAKASERLSRTQSARVQAEARTQIGAAGVGLEGSPLAILAENARQAELEALNIRWSGQMRKAASLQEAKFHKKTIFPTIIGGFAKAGARATQIATAVAGGSGKQIQ